MSNSHMLSNYYSDPFGCGLQIYKMDESAGSFSGKYKQSGCAQINVSGWFQFKSAEQRTDLSFSVGCEVYELEAPYVNGRTSFHYWNARRTIKGTANEVQVFRFNQKDEREVVPGESAGEPVLRLADLVV